MSTILQIATQEPSSDVGEGDDVQEVFIDPPLHIHESKIIDMDVVDAFANGPSTITQEEMDGVLARLAIDVEEMRKACRVEQRTPQWHAYRKYRVGSSRSYAATGKSYKTPYSHFVGDLLYGSMQDGPVGFACLQGTRNEPLCEAGALQTYQRDENARCKALHIPAIRHIEVVHEGTLIWPRHPMFNASIDGVAFVQYEDDKWDVFGCEWKCPLMKGGYKGSVPIEYYYQVQQQLTIYEDSGHLYYLMAQRDIDPSQDMVVGWKWRSMFAVWQRGVILQRQFIPWDKPKFMTHVEEVKALYMKHVVPRIIRMERGEIQFPCIDWAPPLVLDDPVDVLSDEDDGQRSITDATEVAHACLGILQKWEDTHTAQEE